MSRLIAAAILLAFIGGCCIAGNVLVGNCCSRLDSLLNTAKQAVAENDLERAGVLADKAEVEYTNGEHWLFMFMDHSLVENLGEEFAKLPDLATQETKSEFLSQLNAVKTAITHIERDNQPSLRSVF